VDSWAKLGVAEDVAGAAKVAGAVTVTVTDVEQMRGGLQKVVTEMLGFGEESWVSCEKGNERSATGSHGIGKKRLVLAGLGTGIDGKPWVMAESISEDLLLHPEKSGAVDYCSSCRQACGALSDLKFCASINFHGSYTSIFQFQHL
jgi:hypothetical protein